MFVEMKKGKFCNLYYNQVTNVFFVMMISSHINIQASFNAIVLATSSFNDALKRFNSIERKLNKGAQKAIYERKLGISSKNDELSGRDEIRLFYNTSLHYIELRENNKIQPIIKNQSVA